MRRTVRRGKSPVPQHGEMCIRDSITSGGVDGYINNQYLLTGDEAKSKAKELVKLRAIVTTDNLNIRKEPALDPNNVIGQALLNERYVVLGLSLIHICSPSPQSAWSGNDR